MKLGLSTGNPASAVFQTTPAPGHNLIPNFSHSSWTNLDCKFLFSNLQLCYSGQTYASKWCLEWGKTFLRKTFFFEIFCFFCSKNFFQKNIFWTMFKGVNCPTPKIACCFQIRKSQNLRQTGKWKNVHVKALVIPFTMSIKLWKNIENSRRYRHFTELFHLIFRHHGTDMQERSLAHPRAWLNKSTINK